MAKISAQDFVGTRARFQRIGDAKLFAGWIEDFFGNKVVISTNTNHLVNIGDEFRFEGFGNRIAVVFNAKLDAVAKLDMANESVLTEVEGTNAKILEAKRVKLELQVCSPVRFSASHENLRMLSPDIFTVLNEGAEQVEGFMIDIAKQGIGFVSKKKVKPKEYVEVRMETRIGTIEAKGNIRYCLPDKDRTGFYRVGIMFTDMDRVNRPRWTRFLSQNHE
ncbi:MAG: PilZ domain-containing protein [Fimbriimonadaceae bacterium]